MSGLRRNYKASLTRKSSSNTHYIRFLKKVVQIGVLETEAVCRYCEVAKTPRWTILFKRLVVEESHSGKCHRHIVFISALNNKVITN